MSSSLPEISGDQLIRLLELDGWEIHGKRTHGISLKKKIEDRTLSTVIPTKGNSPIKTKTLG